MLRTEQIYLTRTSDSMPKLGEYQYLLDTVFFLYPSVEDAKTGKKAGGTGFFVAVPSEKYPDHFHHLYAVTNWHVALGTAESAPCPVIRVNAKNGAPKIYEFDPAEWHFIGGGPDLAILPLSLNANDIKAEALIAESFCLTKADITNLQINAGEDAFMLGRFIDYDGIEENCPSMRFGNISMMAVKQMQPTGYSGNSFVVDMHSRTGFSGSPVFIYRTGGSIFAKPQSIVGGGHTLKLLGVLWGQYPEEWELRDGPKALAAMPLLTGKTIRGMSGMSLVCPAEHILEMLNMPIIKQMREQEIEQFKS